MFGSLRRRLSGFANGDGTADGHSDCFESVGGQPVLRDLGRRYRFVH